MWALEQILRSRNLERLPFKVGNHAQLHRPEVGWELIRQAVEARTGDPSVLLALARAAEVVAEKIADEELRLRARAEIANAHRIRGELSVAQRLLDEQTLDAVEVLPHLTRAEIYSRYGDILIDDLAPEAAVPYFVRALHLARSTPLATEYRVCLARALLHCRRFREAQRYLNEALLELQTEEPERPRVLGAAYANAVELFVEWARGSDSPWRRKRMLGYAEHALRPARAYLRRHGFERWSVTLEWIVARGHLAAQQYDLAVVALDAVLDAFLALEDPATAAAVALDLGEAHLGRGEVEEIHALAAACCRIFQQAGLPADLLRTFELLEAAESLRAARTLIRRARKRHAS